MRRIALTLVLVIVAACAKKDEAPPIVVPTPPAATIDLTTVAGTWNMHVMGASSDSVLTTYTLNATAGTDGWVMTLPNRDPIMLRITVSGDSIMSETPEYESVLRKGVKVRTNSVFHMSGGNLTGKTTAHYPINGPDSVVMLRTAGTRAPM